jgi:hypothetical protein
MKKNFNTLLVLHLVACFLFAHTLSAQTMKHGKETEINKKATTNVKAIMETSKGIFCIYTPIQASFFSPSLDKIQRFDKNLTLQKEFVFDLGSKLVIDDARQMGDEIYLILRDYQEHRDKKLNYIAHRINQETLELEQPAIILEIMPNKQALIDINQPTFFNTLSDDKQKIGILGIPNQKRAEQQILGLSVYDSTMKPLWKRTETLPYEQKLFRADDYYVDDLGRLFIIAKIYKDKDKESVKGLSNYNYTVFMYANATDAPVTYDIPLNGLFVYGFKVMADKQGNNLTCMGLYHTDDSDFQGLFIVNIDMIGKKLTLSKQESFKANIVERLEGERAVKKDKGIGTSFEIRTIVRKPDGGFIVSMERLLKISHFGKYIPATNEVLTVSLSAAGTTQWANVLDKDQRSLNGTLNDLSFGNAIFQDKLFLFFIVNDKVAFNKNPFPYVGADINLGTENWLVAYQIQTNGKSTNKVFLKGEKSKDFILEPTKMFQPKDSDYVYFMLYERKSKTLRLSKISLN